MEGSPFGGGTFAPDPLLLFLQRVVPWSQLDPPTSYVNIHAFGGDSPPLVRPFGGGGRAFGGPVALIEAANSIGYLNRVNSEVFFCCAGVADYDRQYSGRYLRALRKGAKARWHNSLVLDLDVKPGRYASQREALAAWLPFCDEVGLVPGPLVNTGTGLHAYIAFDRAIASEQRQVLARQLVAAAQAHGLKADWGVTTDAVRILRVPTSYNRKDKNNPLLCSVLTLGQTMSVDDVVTALENYSPSVPASGSQPRINGYDFSHLGAPPSNQPPLDPRQLEQARSDLERSREATTIDLVAEGCPLVAASLERGGATDREPLWYTFGKLCHYLQNGRQAFHLLGFKHPGYDTQDSDDKFDRVEQLGWPLCTTFEQTGPEAAAICRACPHYGKGKSPIHFGVGLPGETRPSPPPYVNGHSHAPVASDGDRITFMSNRFVHDDNNYIITPDDRRPVWTNQIYAMQLTMGVTEGGSHGGALRIEFDDCTAQRQRVVADIPTSELASQKDFIKAASKFGLLTNHPKLALEASMDWLTQIQMTRQAHTRNRKGWVMSGPGKITGFATGSYSYDATGAHRVPGQYDAAYDPVGTLEKWQSAISGFIGKGYTEVEILIATAFAAPLVIFTQVDGLVVHARSSGSGKGKSASLEMAQTVWSKRKSRLADATLNSMTQAMTDLNNLPLYVDEMLTEGDRSVRDRNFAKLILDASSGTGRSRLDQTGKQRPRGECCTMMVSAANLSLVQTASGRDTNAQAARVLEIVMPDLGQSATPEEIAAVKHLLDANYGVAGHAYAKALGLHHEGIGKLVLEEMKQLRVEIGSYEHDERYWLATCAVILTGARLAKKLGLVDFNVAAMRQKLIMIYRYQRAVVRDLLVNADDPQTQLNRLALFLNSKIRNRIITDHMPAPRGNPGKQRILNSQYVYGASEFVARYAIEDQKLWVSEACLRTWCDLPGNRYSFETMRNALVVAGFATRDPKKMRNIGGGTELSTSRELVLEFDLALPNNDPLRLTGETDGE